MSAIRLIWSLLLLLAAVSAQAQPEQKNMRAWELKSFSRQALAHGDVYTAIDWLQAYCKAKPNKLKARYKLAELQQRARDYMGALTNYDSVYSKAPGKFPLALFHKAEVEQQLGMYRQATTDFVAYLEDARTSKHYVALANAGLQGCRTAQAQAAAPLDMEITHLENGINMAHIELSPLALDSTTLLFASLRSDTVPGFNPNPAMRKQRAPRRQFYTATRNENGWALQGRWAEAPNDSLVSVGNATISPDGELLFFSRCETTYNGRAKCSIWQAKRNGDGWDAPTPLGSHINHPAYSVTMPAAATKGKHGKLLLYFVAEMPGGEGGNDIWVAEWDEQESAFKSPENAGAAVNTPGNELSPFYDNSTNTLYFSSNGHPGMGGLDVFKASGSGHTFGKPENMGVPVNSPADDVYFTVGAKPDEGFFTSNRMGGTELRTPTCCDDIYHYRWNNYQQLMVEGTVTELSENTTDTLPVADANVTLSLIDSIAGNVPLESTETDSTGQYSFRTEPDKDYQITIERDGYFTQSIPHSTRADEANSAASSSTNTTIVQPAVVEPIVPEKPIQIDNIYFAFDDAELSPMAKQSLDAHLIPLLRENPTLVVELGAHTDSKGSESYNKALSERRAKSVVAYLIENGISRKRLKHKGYGESQLLVQDEYGNGYDEDAQQLNRRTEFKVIGFTK